jgi:hypothetical protein
MRTDKYFNIDWVVHLFMGMVLPVLYMIEYQQTNDAVLMCICIYGLTIPFEGFYLMLSPSTTNSEKISVRAVYFNVYSSMFVFGICFYLFMKYVQVHIQIDLRLLFWISYFLAIGVTYKNKLTLIKHLRELDSSNNMF